MMENLSPINRVGPLGSRHDGRNCHDSFASHRDDLPGAMRASLRAPAEQLTLNRNVYKQLGNDYDALSGLNIESTLGLIELIAEFAHARHPGCFADGFLENRALAIGDYLERMREDLTEVVIDGSKPSKRRDARRLVLHVATSVTAIGGHTRTIRHWAEIDTTSTHSLLLTNQAMTPVPEWLADAILGSGGVIYRLPSEASLSDKALWLREVAQSEAALVVLHHTAFDAVPTVAFARSEGPPVAVLNHADHIFWLGSSVADLVINQRPVGSRLSERRRYVRRNVTLPIPLSLPSKTYSREHARALLGVSPDQIVLLSIGRALKFRPSETHNFLATLGKILEQHPEAVLYIIGMSEQELACPPFPPRHPRVHAMGEVEDPSMYRAAADIYLESFPFGSQTALLESALAGLPAVAAFAPPLELVVTSDDAISDLIPNLKDEVEYVDRVSGLIRDARARHDLGASLRARVLDRHTGKGWMNQLSDVYEEACAMRHAPGPIPSSEFSSSNMDCALSNWQVELSGRGQSRQDLSAEVRQAYFDLAYRVVQTRNLRDAFALLTLCFRRWGPDQKIFWAIVKLPIQLIIQGWRRSP